jgi:hypothetical protein
MSYLLRKVWQDFVTQEDGEWLDTERWRWAMRGETVDGERVELMSRLNSLGFDSREHRELRQYLKYAEDRVRRGLTVEDWDVAQHVPTWLCQMCGQSVVEYHHFGPSYFVMCDRHEGVKRPTLSDVRWLGDFYYGPDKPYLFQLSDIYQNTLTVYDWSAFADTAEGLFEVCVISGGHLKRMTVPWAEALVELPYSHYDGAGGDDITRHNHKTWAEKYKELEGQVWWRADFGYSGKTIVVLAHAMTEAMFNDFACLRDYCSLNDDHLYETQQEMQAEAFNAYIRYEWPDALREAVVEKFRQFGEEKVKEALARLEEILDGDDGQQLLWDCESKLSGSQELWRYEDSETATIVDMEDAAQEITWEMLFPPDPAQLTLDLGEEANDEAA